MSYCMLGILCMGFQVMIEREIFFYHIFLLLAVIRYYDLK